MLLHFTSKIQDLRLKVIKKSELNKYTCINAGKGILYM